MDCLFLVLLMRIRLMDACLMPGDGGGVCGGSDASANNNNNRLHWVERRDEASGGHFYYVDTRTGHSQWDKPAEPYVRWVGATPKPSQQSRTGGYRISLTTDPSPPPSSAPPSRSQPSDNVDEPRVVPVSVVASSSSSSMSSTGGFRPPPIAIPAEGGGEGGLMGGGLPTSSAASAALGKQLVGHIVLATGRAAAARGTPLGPHQQQRGLEPFLALTPSAMGFLKAKTPAARGGSHLHKQPVTSQATPAHKQEEARSMLEQAQDGDDT